MANVLFKPTEIYSQSEGRIDFVEFTLENGLHVILHEDHSTPIVAVNVCYHVGSKNEKHKSFHISFLSAEKYPHHLMNLPPL